MLKRNFVLCAFSLSVLFLSIPAARAQDAFAGADNSSSAASTGKVMTLEEFEKAAPLITKMNEALNAGKIPEYAMYAYKLSNLTGVDTYKELADLATGEEDVPPWEARDLLEHKEILQKIYKARGKSEADYISYIENLEQSAVAGCGGSEAARLRMQAAVEGKRSLGGFRKLASSELRVYIQPPQEPQQFMLRHCIRRSLEQICAATHGALKLKFVKADEANVSIDYEYREPLWYTYQTHSTSIIPEPLDAGNINYVRLKIPMKATVHRNTTEAEGQEYCLRELPRALGLTWHPVSRERFSYDFSDVIASVSKRSVVNNEQDLANVTGPARLKGYVDLALHDTRNNSFEYFAGLAYLERGDTAMARRFLVAASPFLIAESVSMHSVITRLLNTGDALGAELVAIACINDDPDNDENSQATKEYNRVRKQPATSSPRVLPTLPKTESALLAKIYEAPHVVSSK